MADDDDKVVELRPGRGSEALTCARCGGDLWVATVTIDRATLRPVAVTDSGDRPVIRCYTCGRGHDPRESR